MSMTKKEREKIVFVISDKIQKEGLVPLKNLPQVFDKEGIDRALYNGIGPKKWIKDNFPEFCIEGTNGKEIILFAAYEQVRAILSQSIENKGGKILLSEISELLRQYGIDYKKYSQGKKLLEWLQNSFPEFMVTSDNRWLYNSETLAQSTSLNSFTESFSQDSLSESSLEEIKQMHSTVFMNWWNNNIKRLKQYNEDLDSTDRVKEKVAHQFAKVILGVPGILVGTDEKDESKIAFESGLQSKSGENIYCVLKNNPENVDGTKINWVLEDFACVDEDTMLGNWLKQHCAYRYSAFSALEENAINVKQQREELIPLLNQCLADLEHGIIPEAGLADKYASFEKAFMDLKNAYEEVWGKQYPNNLTIEEIIEGVGEQAIVGRISNAVSSFDSIINKVDELFAECKLKRETLQNDKSLIHNQYDKLNNSIELGLFEKTLTYYRILLHVMSADTLTDSVAEQIEELCAHFIEVGSRAARMALIGVDEDKWNFSTEIENIEKVIIECKQVVSDTTKRKQVNENDAISCTENLLEIALQKKNDRLRLSVYAEAIYPEDSFAGILIQAETEDLLKYVDDNDINDVENIQEIIKNKDFPMELTYYGAATRLFMVMGNREQLAEKYYLLGLACGEINCVKKLLIIYREADRRDWFQRIFSHFCLKEKMSLEDQLYYLSIMCEDAPGSAIEFAHSNYYLLYLEESLRLLISMPVDSFSSEDEVRQLESRLSAVTKKVEDNSLEQAIIEGNGEKIRSIVNDKERLIQLGYTDEEIMHAQAVKIEEELNKSEWDFYKIGTVLYMYQGNFHGMAERYLWKGIANSEQIYGELLLQILTQEGRWGECCELYECFEKAYAENEKCRQLYLISLLHYNIASAQNYICQNLQDSLAMMGTEPIVLETVQQLAASDDMGDNSFFRRIMSLMELLSDPFVKSVVFMDSMLREYSEPIKAREMGLSENIVNSISGVYKSDSYPHGMDAVNISERTFKFFGSYKGVSEAFAKIALPDQRAINQLWKLYNDLADEQQQFELMQTFPHMRKEHKDLYIKVLFQKEKYAEFLQNCDLQEESPDLELQIFIAKMKTNPESAGEFPAIAHLEHNDIIIDWMQVWGTLLTSTLIKNERLNDVETLFFAFFNKWTEKFSDELIQNIVTAEGAASSEQLLKIQEDALEKGYMEIALYLFNVLHIGQLELQAKQYMDGKTENIENYEIDEQLSLLQQLRAIYGKNLEDLNSRIAMLHIQRIKENKSLKPDEAAKEIGDVMKGLPGDGEILNNLFNMLDDTALCYYDQVYANLTQVARKACQEQNMALFFNKMVKSPEMGGKDSLLSFVYNFYIDLFVDGKFPQEILRDTSGLCIRHIRYHKHVDGILCLYFVERALKEDYYADYLLRMLAENSIDMTGEKLGEIISNQIQTVWGSDLPSYYDLFKTVLNDLSLQETEKYVHFANRVPSTDTGRTVQFQSIINKQENKIISEDDSNIILQLLFTNIENAAVWKQCIKLPLEDNPTAYAKLKFIASQYNPELWEECVGYCMKYEQIDLLRHAIYAWASGGAAKDMQECRKYLEDQLKIKPDYFDLWKDEDEGNNRKKQEELLDISNAICRRTKQAGEFHAAISAASYIAIKTGLPEAWDYLLEQFGYELLGDFSNLGFAMSAYLMLDKRFEEAGRFISKLNKVVTPMNYKDLVSTLSDLKSEELESWLNKPENEIMLNLVLPEGNSPGHEEIQSIVYKGIMNGQAKETANVLRNIVNMFPADYASYNGLFDLCCTKFEGYEFALHECLTGLISVNTEHKDKYRRTRKQYANMLAVLDAIIINNDQTGRIESYGYFGNIRQFCIDNNLGFNDAADVQRIYEDILSELKKDRELDQAYLCCITGNWETFLEGAWTERTDIRDKIGIKIEEMDDIDIGFAHSMLKVLLHIEKDRRQEFIEWISSILPNDKGMRHKQLDFVKEIFENGYFENLENQKSTEQFNLGEILQNPFEDNNLQEFFIKYVNSAVEENFDYLYEMVRLISFLVYHEEFLETLSKIADSLFDEGNDKLAGALYRAMHDMNGMHWLNGRNGPKRKYKYSVQKFTARYRITSLFQNDEEMREKVRGSDFHVWSCINMVLTLMDSKRADEVDHLKLYLTANHVNVADAILKGFDKTIAAEEKLSLIDTIEGDVEKAYYCYVLKYPYNPKQPSSYALSAKVAERVNNRYVSIVGDLHDSSAFNGLTPKSQLLISNKLNSVRQKAISNWTFIDNESIATGEKILDEVPFFADGVEPLSLYDNEDMNALFREHDSILNLTENLQKKYDISKKIYQYCLGRECSENEKENAILLYGVDFYYVSLSVNGDRETANKAALLLSGRIKRKQTKGSGNEAVKKMIRDTALYELLQFSDSLKDLINVYSNNRPVFQFMRDQITDSSLRQCIDQIYSALDMLINCYSTQGGNEYLKEDLSKILQQLEKIAKNRWMDLKNNVQKLIINEINGLNRCPMLQIEILNQGIQRNYGYLYGQVRNIGTVAAENIVLQANYSNDSNSRQYILKRMSPGASAVFEINYGSAPGTEKLSYCLHVEFSYNGKSDMFVTKEGELQFGEIEEPDYPDNIIYKDANGIRFVVDTETGEVYSPEFFGRKNETEKLRALVKGNDFGDYQSALLRGIRRTGKTSLLNYLETYIQAYRSENVVCVKVDCQTIPLVNCIQYVFIDYVIDIIEREAKEKKECWWDPDDWDSLKATWFSPNFCADQHPEKLGLFYMDLKRILGRGLYLIIDEIDRLFQQVEDNHRNQESQSRNLDSLFGSLSAMLGYNRECVHFVICGSNWLIRYSMKGDKTNQLFQRFSNIIEVGKLPKDAVRDIIRKPCEEYPGLIITDEAIDLIWDYIGGLVWHTKLLGQEAIRRAKEDNRRIVYPSDVQQCLPKVLDDHWCKQFYEGCETEEEKNVVEALQSRAAKRDEYISIDVISKMMGCENSDIENTMMILKDLKIVEQHPINSQRYRFGQDIYRRYFRTRESRKYERLPEEPDIFQDRQQLDDINPQSVVQAPVSSAEEENLEGLFD